MPDGRDTFVVTATATLVIDCGPIRAHANARVALRVRGAHHASPEAACFRDRVLLHSEQGAQALKIWTPNHLRKASAARARCNILPSSIDDVGGASSM